MKIAKSKIDKPETELERFARFFHQDFGLCYPDAESGGQTYLIQLSDVNRPILKQQISKLLKDHPGKKGQGLRKAWIRAGASWSQRGPELKKFLKDFSDRL